MKVNGPRSSTKLQTELPTRPPFVSNFLNKTEEDIQRRFVLEANPNFATNRLWFTNGTSYRYSQLDNTSIVNANVPKFSKDSWNSDYFNFEHILQRCGYTEKVEISFLHALIFLLLHDIKNLLLYFFIIITYYSNASSEKKTNILRTNDCSLSNDEVKKSYFSNARQFCSTMIRLFTTTKYSFV